MAGTLNKVMIIGRVGRDPEMRYTPSGTPVASFSVATNWRRRTPEGESKEETEWFNVVAWNRQAEFANQYIRKGGLVYVEGRLQTRSWEGQDGQKRYRTEVVANAFQLLDSRGRPAETEEAVPLSNGDIEPDEIPF
ncbi:MAG: single-stranded DNA-binding protein [Bacteroidetes bacterium]|nr:single-stranded DNA-binding protein [Bacteroidota bacterium]MCL5026801.1 single-stranded DNA-binding protein [Chloroflexota bacterium]